MDKSSKVSADGTARSLIFYKYPPLFYKTGNGFVRILTILIRKSPTMEHT